MTTLRDVTATLEAASNPSKDAFGRLRVSNPTTLFNSKQLHDAQPLFWDDQEVSGASTGSSYDADRASSILSVAATTAGKRVRQTFQRFNYQSGKSQLVLMTGILDYTGGGTGITTAMGAFDDDNGIFLQKSGTTVSMNIRSSVTGSPVDTSVAQASWNGDPLDGTGDSGITLDTTKTQIFWCDYEWLGVGDVRTGFVIDGEFIVAHTFQNANAQTAVYMSTPNLPLRYEIDNDATGALSSMETICATVMTEGGQQAQGTIHFSDTGTTAIAPAADAERAILGIRLQSTKLDSQVDVTNVSALNTAASGSFYWRLYFDKGSGVTYGGTALSYSAVTNSVCDFAFASDNTSTISGAVPIAGGLVPSGGGGAQAAASGLNAAINSSIRLGSLIDGTQQAIVLTITPLDATGDIYAGLGWQELG